jgi:DNA-binding NtrC family response regulator
MTERASFYEARAIADTRYLLRALKEAGWNVTQAAAACGLNRTYLYELMRQLGIQPPAKAANYPVRTLSRGPARRWSPAKPGS